jgi:hypothetical protein
MNRLLHLRITSLILWLVLGPSLLPAMAWAATKYVDATAATCATYTPATRACGSGSANNYATAFVGIRAITAGDQLYFRGGTHSVSGTYGNNGTDTYGCNPTCPSSWATATRISNYPGEVAIIRFTGSGGFNMDNDNYPNGLSYLIWEGDSRSNFVFDGNSLGSQALRVNNAVSHIRMSTLTIKNFTDFGIQGGTSNSCTKKPQTIEVLNTEVRGNGNNGSVTNQTHGIYPSCGDGWKIDGNYLPNNWAYGIHANPGNQPTFLTDLTITNNTVEGRMGPCCTVSNQFAAGIVYTAGTGALVANNVVIGRGNSANQLQAGIQLGSQNAGLATNNRAYNNTLVGPFTSGGFYLSGSTGSLIQNNLITATANPYLIDHGWSVASASNNICNVADPDVTGGCGTVNATPLFVNAALLDFHLQAASPAVNAGVTLSSVPTDKDGVARPQGLAYDIGAYERTGADVTHPGMP